MPMPISVLEAELRSAFPDSEISIEDLAGDGDHYKARIVSPAFRGLSRVRQRIGLAGLTPGTYDLEVTLRDPVSGAQAVRRQSFEIVSQRAP